MIYVFSSFHLKSADADQDKNHTSKLWSKMSFYFSLFSVIQCGCKICWNGNLMLLYPEMYLHGIFVACACTFCLLPNKLYIHHCWFNLRLILTLKRWSKIVSQSKNMQGRKWKLRSKYWYLWIKKQFSVCFTWFLRIVSCLYLCMLFITTKLVNACLIPSDKGAVLVRTWFFQKSKE